MYVIKRDGKVAESPQQMFMRVAIGIHKNEIGAAIETYELLSERWFTHATPTLFNAGTPHLSRLYLSILMTASLLMRLHALAAFAAL